MTSRGYWTSLILVVAITVPGLAAAQARPGARYVGSAACRDCHADIYARWEKTRMANILVDIDEHPEAVLGDFSTPNPLVGFDLDDVDFTYGSKWKQRYFTKVGDDYFVLPAQWDVMHGVWRRYHPEAGSEWWTPYYGDDQMERPTGPLCDGCHSTNYDIATKQVTEWNVGCEKCHGPGSEHVADPTILDIVNPDRLDYVRGNDVCIQCHSQGQPPRNPIDGKYYDWPVGYTAGDRLADYWHLDDHVLGDETSTHWPEGSAHKNRMQGNDYVTSLMYSRGIRCSACHDVHGTSHDAELVKEPRDLCLSCHGPESPLGPRGTTIAQHTQHSAEKVECVDCHMPQIARTIADVNVRSHTFRFISPADSEKYGIPNPCTSCHTDMTNEEAQAELKNWGSISPWRVGG